MVPNLLPADDAHRIFIIRVLQLAASIAGLYDHLLTLDAEILYIWRKKWSALKCTFLFNRYLSMTMLIANLAVFMSESISERFCDIYIRIQAITTILLVLGVQTIMQYRLYAIYERNRTLIMTILSLWLLQIAAIATILGVAGSTPFPTSTRSPATLPTTYSLCTPIQTPVVLPALWLPIILFESVLVALAISRGYFHIIQFAKYGDWWCPKLLSAVLVRDSILYFGLNLVTYSITATVWLIGAHDGWIEAPEGICVAITAVMGARIVLNLREAYHDAPHTVTFATTTTTGVPAEDIGWAPRKGKSVVPMWWMKPLEGRMLKKGIVLETPETSAGGTVVAPARNHGPVKVAPPHRGRRRGQLESAIAFSGPTKRRPEDDYSDSELDEDDNDNDRHLEPLSIDRNLRTPRINIPNDADLEGSPTTLVGSAAGRAPWRWSKKSTPASSLISGGSVTSAGTIGTIGVRPSARIRPEVVEMIRMEEAARPGGPPHGGWISEETMTPRSIS